MAVAIVAVENVDLPCGGIGPFEWQRSGTGRRPDRDTTGLQTSDDTAADDAGGTRH